MAKKITLNFTKSDDWSIKSDSSLMEIMKSLTSWAYRMIIMLVQDVRSPEQNSWYWWVLTQIALSLKWSTYDWMSKDDWHEAFWQSFLSEQKFIWPLSYLITRSTSTLDKAEFTEYIEKILTFCEKELKIPRKNLLPKFTDMECPF